MSTARRLHFSYDEYLAVEEQGDVKHEFLDGEIYAMAGGTPEHGALAMRVARGLEAKLPGCTALSSDVRVHIAASGLTTYPDVSFVCGPLERSAADPSAIVNPSLVVEVTSRSTEDYDRGDKLSHYKQLTSLRCVLLVSHREHRITLVERTATGWSVSDHRSGEVVALRALGGGAVELAVDDVYAVLTQLA
jgi:Uma2 family endonuclease